jgi:hypothetical protein
MERKIKPQRPGPGATGEESSQNSSNEITSTPNPSQSLATPRVDEDYRRYLERAPKWECVAAGCGIAYTSQGHMNIHTWRLAVPGGWIYKVTERDDADHFIVQICFVPELRVMQ